MEISLLLLALDALVLLALILRTYRRRWYRPMLRNDAATRRARRDAQCLMRDIERWSSQLDDRINVRLAQLRDMVTRAEEVADRLGQNDGIRASIEPDSVMPEAVRQPLTEQEEPTTPMPTEASLSPSDSQDTPSSYVSHAEVRRLSESGLEALAIARRLGRPLGEVELIIRLSEVQAVGDRQG